MRTEPLAAAVLLLASPVALAQLEVGIAPEVTVVGLSAGARAEVTWRPGAEGTASRLRVAPGYLVGPEFQYVPVALGYRAVYRSQARVRPVLGAGAELQHRWVADAAPVTQLGAYLEAGVLFGFGPHLSVGVLGTLDVTFLGGAGAGLAGRGYVGWAF